MNCDCITRVNSKLAEQNLALDVTFMLSTATDTLSISTHWKDSSKKVRGKKPTAILVSYCPFCGTKVEASNGQLHQEQATINNQKEEGD